MAKSAMEPLLRLILIPGRIRFLWRNRNRRKVTAGLIQTLKQRCDEATRAGVPAYFDVYNAGLFVALLEQDISAFNESIYLAPSEWHRQFHARGLAVLLYEGSEDVPQILGKKYRDSLKVLELGPDWFAALNSVSGKLSRFRQNHSEFLKNVRSLVGAHKDHNASAQLDLLVNLKSIEIYQLGAEFSEPLRELIAFNMRLLGYMHNPAVMLRQVAKAVSARDGA